MTRQRWGWSVLHCAGWAAAFWYAVYHVQSGAGLVIYLGLLVSAFLLMVNTVDLLFGRWLRRGAQPIVLNQVVIDKMLIAHLSETERVQDEWRPARRN